MTNQEVDEFMQRYLDNDLSEDESAALMEHLRHSPASAALFERLKRLDHELEQLPKVTPPSSIVDSILPRLNLAGMLEHSPETDTSSVPLDAVRESFLPLERKKSLRERINYRMLGGVVAVGVVLTLFMTSFGPQLTFLDTTSESANESMTMEAQSILPPDQLTPRTAADQAEYNGTFMDVNQGVLGRQAEPEVQGIMGMMDMGDSIQPQFNPDSPVSNENVPPADELPQEVSKEKGIDHDSSKEIEGGFTLSVPDADEAPQLLSPNELLLAAVTTAVDGGQQITITKENDGESIVQSTVYTGELINLVWASDSSQLHFEVLSADGVTEHITLLIEQKMEIKK